MTIIDLQDTARKLALEGLNARIIARRLDCHLETAISAVRWSYARTFEHPERGPGTAAASERGRSDAAANQPK